ncbi:putative candidate secreted effector protein [Blumeria hordei DH14]|uniref:Putative candidate secreted effector protein n=1 Tax=Blumeria graminis f. sp. hordei (strain DH14) TaxID=546991 RepID=N1JBH9_BLUG1|nr:putative candidate secreted effector protein [Blumeria hordei DH14]
MRLLPLASFIALMSHLISVSAEYKYVCPSKTKFTTVDMGNLRERIKNQSLHEGVYIEKFQDVRSYTYTFDRKTIDGGHRVRIFVNARLYS